MTKSIIKVIFTLIKSKLHTHNNKPALDKISETMFYSYDTHLSNDNVHLKNLLYDADINGGEYSKNATKNGYTSLGTYKSSGGGLYPFSLLKVNLIFN